jgi:hypothetical protein
MHLSKKKAGAVSQITMSKITNPMASMHPCNIIPTHLFFPSSYLPIFPSSLFTPWSPKAKGNHGLNAVGD